MLLSHTLSSAVPSPRLALATGFGVLFILWWREDRAETAEVDRIADETDDAEWRAYNEMLAQYTSDTPQHKG